MVENTGYWVYPACPLAVAPQGTAFQLPDSLVVILCWYSEGLKDCPLVGLPVNWRGPFL
jgi:hypothetical protein